MDNELMTLYSDNKGTAERDYFVKLWLWQAVITLVICACTLLICRFFPSIGDKIKSTLEYILEKDYDFGVFFEKTEQIKSVISDAFT